MLGKPDVIHVSLVHVVCTRRLRQSLPLSLSLFLWPSSLTTARRCFFLVLFNGTVSENDCPPPPCRPWLIFIFRINEDRAYQRPWRSQRLSLEFKHVPDMLGHYHLQHLVFSLSPPSFFSLSARLLPLSRFFPLVSSSSSSFCFHFLFDRMFNKRSTGCP